MAQTEHLPIYKAAYDLCLHLEQVVSRFGRAHRYGLGAELREGATPCRWAAFAIGTSLRRLSSLGCRELRSDHPCDYGILGHPAPMIRHFGKTPEIDPIGLQPLRQREQVHVADGVDGAHDPWTLKHLVFDQIETLSDRLRDLFLHRLDSRRVIGPAITAHPVCMRNVNG
jgi:hypothetical protein